MSRTTGPALAFVLAALAAGCLPDVRDYWASLEGGAAGAADADADADADGDADGDGDGDTDSDSDSDTDECAETEITCGDGGPDGDADADTDTGQEPFCDSPEYAEFLAQEPIVFDNTGAPVLGNGIDPEAVITGFSNFLCSHCATAAAVIEELMADPAYGERVAYRFRHFPFSSDPEAIAVQDHRAAAAAHMQGAFFPMHDALFDNYPVVDEETLLALVGVAGLDEGSFAADYASDASLAAVLADRAAGQDAGVSGTPSIFVDGRKVVPWPVLPDVLDCLLGYAP